MEIHIDRLGEKMGPYSIEEASELLRKQTLHDTDLAWHEGMGKWELLPSVLASIHPTLTADQAAPPKVEISGDLRKQKDPEDSTAEFVPPSSYPSDNRHAVNDEELAYQVLANRPSIWNIGLTINVWGFIFLLLFFGAHRPVIDFLSKRSAGDISGHWWGEDETLRVHERKNRELGIKNSVSKTLSRTQEMQDLEETIGLRKADDLKLIFIYSFNINGVDQYSVRTGQFSIIKFRRYKDTSNDRIYEDVLSISEYGYTIRGNKIIYREKRGSDGEYYFDSNIKNKPPLRPGAFVINDNEDKFWYYKVSSDGMQLLLSSSPDFIEPIKLKKSAKQFP